MSDQFTPRVLRDIAANFSERYDTGKVRGLLVAGSGLALEVPGWRAAEEVALAEVFPFELHELMGHSQTMTL